MIGFNLEQGIGISKTHLYFKLLGLYKINHIFATQARGAW